MATTTTPHALNAASIGWLREEWLDGRVWALTPGVDYPERIKNISGYVHTVAKRRGLSVVTKHRDGKLVVQFGGEA